MLDVKTAVGAAAKAAADFYDGKKITGLELEEVDRTEDDRYWLITLGFNLQSPARANNLNTLLDPHGTRGRKYKIFKVNAEDGAVVSMKIREI